MARNNGGKPPGDSQVARAMRATAGHVWHAGRDAYSRVEAEGGRLFGGLLSIGGRIDREAKSRVFEARSSATQAWERIEEAFVQRVGRALNSLQIPTARDVQELSRRVEALQKAVVALERRAAQAAAPERARGRTKAGGRAGAAAHGTKPAPARARKRAGS